MTKFEPVICGQPDPAMSPLEYQRILDHARQSGHNVYFGEGWREPQTASKARLVSASQPPVQLGYLESIIGSLLGWL